MFNNKRRRSLSDQDDTLLNEDEESREEKKLKEFTVDEVIEDIGFGKFHILAVCIAGLVWMADATEIMLLSFLSPSLRCTWELSEEEEASLSTAIFLGMMIGSTFWGTLSDRIGRKPGIIAALLIILAAGIGSAFSPNYLVLLVLRTCVGLGASGGHVAITWLSEFTPVDKRGTLILFTELFFAAGSILEAFLAWLTLTTSDLESWRWLLGYTCIPVAFVFLLALFIPESPRYLIVNGKTQEAKLVLDRVAMINGLSRCCNNQVENVSDDGDDATQKKKNRFHQQEYSLVAFKDQDEPKYSKTTNIVKALFSPGLRRTTFLLLAIWLVSAFFYYGVILLVVELYSTGDGHCTVDGLINNTSVNVTNCSPIPDDKYLDVAITSSAEIPGVVLSLIAMEKIGRKKTIVFEFFVLGVLIFALYACMPPIALTVILFLLRAIITGAYQVIYAYTPEVYPTFLRSSALGICGSFARIGGMITPFVAIALFEVPEYGALYTLLVYGFSALLAALCALFLTKETMGQKLKDHLEEVDMEVDVTRKPIKSSVSSSQQQPDAKPKRSTTAGFSPSQSFIKKETNHDDHNNNDDDDDDKTLTKGDHEQIRIDDDDDIDTDHHTITLDHGHEKLRQS
eukprot:TRINITY_DN1392_c0_g1_i3.p1 TRINITY_DN1392_c0_g1~~TRINITY_DN1392_c0_g1_i3.p1  ORF type:complete len:626 (-),score=147.83 TRINITY_DN1392_c0_g1_i3:270-2147(-)